MEVTAKMRFTGISARKARLVIDEVRGMHALDAVSMLDHMPQRAARVLSGTITSALHNASENLGLNQDEMYIKTVFADRHRYVAGEGSLAAGDLSPGGDVLHILR